MNRKQLGALGDELAEQWGYRAFKFDSNQRQPGIGFVDRVYVCYDKLPVIILVEIKGEGDTLKDKDWPTICGFLSLYSWKSELWDSVRYRLVQRPEDWEGLFEESE